MFQHQLQFNSVRTRHLSSSILLIIRDYACATVIIKEDIVVPGLSLLFRFVIKMKFAAVLLSVVLASVALALPQPNKRPVCRFSINY